MRNLFAVLAGSLFGAGLMVSGMTDPRKVQGWLDIFGDWDPTLAFVMGGAILPMAIAWRVAAARQPMLGGTFPVHPEPDLNRDLVFGSVLFGIGWGLSGLCPGPGLASLSFGGASVWIFVLAMIAGMVGTPSIRTRLDALSQSA